MTTLEDDGFEDQEPYWFCEECCYIPDWKIPTDREKYYKNLKARKCLNCKSEAVTMHSY